MRRLPLRLPPRMRGKAKNRCRSCPLTRITPACAGKSHSVTDANASSWDHPRVCGEKALQSSVNCTMEGSPPRMRGKESKGNMSIGGFGITPAYAGKSILASISMRVVQGSPPRMRGKEQRRKHVEGQCGITPAYAGKSTRLLIQQLSLRDHPRVCGEKFDLDCTCVTELGSPPRMRGKGPDDRAHPLVPGITPAYAGKRGRDK